MMWVECANVISIAYFTSFLKYKKIDFHFKYVNDMREGKFIKYRIQR